MARLNASSVKANDFSAITNCAGLTPGLGPLDLSRRHPVACGRFRVYTDAVKYTNHMNRNTKGKIDAHKTKLM